MLIYFWHARLVVELFCSLEMGRHYLPLLNDNRLESHPREAWVDGYPEVPVFHLSWKDGNIKSSLRVNTSMLFGNAGLKATGIKINLRMNCQWMMKSVLSNLSLFFRFL